MYSFHHCFKIHSVLKNKFDIEYARLIEKYGRDNIELIKELTFAFQYRCWINDDGCDKRKEKYRIFNDSENTYSIVYEDEDISDYVVEV